MVCEEYRGAVKRGKQVIMEGEEENLVYELEEKKGLSGINPRPGLKKTQQNKDEKESGGET